MVETNISVCFCRVRFVYPFPQLLFIDHSLLPDAICLPFSLPHSCEQSFLSEVLRLLVLPGCVGSVEKTIGAPSNYRSASISAPSISQSRGLKMLLELASACSCGKITIKDRGKARVLNMLSL